MADTDIVQFDPSTLMQGVKDRIKATFVSLIPDEHWESLVKVETDRFFEKRDDSWARQREWGKMSDFQKICFEEFEALTRTKIKETIETYTSDTWTDNGPKVNEELSKLILENGNKIFTSIIGSMFQQAINNMQRN